MKYIWIFIGVVLLSLLGFILAGIALGDETGVVLLAVQNSVIITFLIYFLLKQNRKNDA